MSEIGDKVLGKTAKKEESEPQKENLFTDQHIWQVYKKEKGKVLFTGRIVYEMIDDVSKKKVECGEWDFEYNGFSFKLVK